MSLNRHAGLVSASNVISNEIPPPTEPVLKTCSFKIKAPNSKFQILFLNLPFSTALK